MLPDLADPGDGWRVEVNFGGRFYNFRRGSLSARVGRYGGKFADLPDERKVQYVRNKQTKARTKADPTR